MGTNSAPRVPEINKAYICLLYTSLAVAGASGHHQQAAGLEGAVFVEVVPAGVGTPLQAVLVEGGCV